jgi:diguanylate cyclase (GGDEF)-like protein/PAS domain S-box-containing protein
MPSDKFSENPLHPAGPPADATFRRFIENLPAMFYAVEPTAPHMPLYVSPSFEEFGYPISDWYTKSDIWDRIIHDEDKDRVLSATREAMREGRSIDFEYRVVCRDGHVIWVRDRSCFTKDEDGTPLCWQGVIMDVTARKAAVEELQKRELLYRQLARTIPKTAVLLFDHDLRYTLAEGEQLSRHSWSADMFESKTLWEVFPPEIAEEWSGYYERALAGEDLVMQMDNADGAFQVDVRPVRDDEGRIFAGMVMWRDVTAAQRANDALRVSETRYRQLFENASDIIYVHDLDGNYISINEAGLRTFGYTLEEALKLNMRDIVAPECQGLVKQQLQEKIAGTSRLTVYEVDCISKQGDRLTLEVNSSIVTSDGEAVSIHGVARDITERKATEAALRESRANLARAQRIAHLGSWELELAKGSAQSSVEGSDEVYRIFGYEPGSVDLTAKFIYGIIRPQDRKRFRSAFTAAARSGTSPDLTVRIILPNGTERIVDVKAETTCDAETGAPARMVGTVQDITQRVQAEEALRLSEARFRDLFENANDLIYTHDLEGNFTSLNRTGELITGYSRDEALRMNIASVVAPEFLEAARSMVSRKLNNSAPTTYELEIVSKAGERVILELSTRLIVADGLPVGVQGVGRDITERRRAEQSLFNTLSLLSTTFESTGDGIVVMSLDRELVTCNRKFVEMWNIPEGIVDGKDAPRLINHIASQLKNGEEFLRKVEELYADNAAVATETLELKDGRVFERNSQPQLLDGKAIGRVACFRDVTERSRAEEKLRHHAMHDTLTNLPNRAQFMMHLDTAIERARANKHARFAVLFLDLDRFKVINDSLGHVVGDRLLVAIGERLASCVRPGDVVARLGGDEFVVLLNRTGDSEEIARVAERLQKRISAPFAIDNYEVFTTASIGIIVASDLDRRAEDFLRDADAAMYRAKESGKARYEVFDREMHVRNLNLLQVETDLRHALERNQFEVVYQPIASLEDNSVYEFEALLRWQHPEHGIVGPDEFISVAEETGLIVPIGRWILREACRQTAIWHEVFGRDLSVSVNLSAKELMHPKLIEQIKAVLVDTGLKARYLRLEVTESNVMEHSERSLSVLNEITSLGISVSTDDFGTGYSSLSYLQQFPFSRLKIDRSFVKRIGDDDKSVAIVKTILMLGENLGIEVLAEGIETNEHLETLRRLGCRFGQGYLFARPLTKREAEAVLKNGLPNALPMSIPDASYVELEHHIS